MSLEPPSRKEWKAAREHNLPFMALTINVAFDACAQWGQRDQGNESYADSYIRDRSKKWICLSQLKIFTSISLSLALQNFSAISCPLQVISVPVSCQHSKSILSIKYIFFSFRANFLFSFIQTKKLWDSFILSFSLLISFQAIYFLP